MTGANTGRRAVTSTPTRQSAEILGASSTQRDTTSPSDDMMDLHRPTTKKGPGDATNAPDPAPDRTEGFT